MSSSIRARVLAGAAMWAVILLAAGSGPTPVAGLPYHPVAWQDSCQPLPPPAGPIIDVDPSQADHLASIVAGAPSGTTVRLASGIYNPERCRLVPDARRDHPLG